MRPSMFFMVLFLPLQGSVPGGLLAVNCREEVGWACCAAVPSPGGRWGPEKILPPVFLGVPSGQRPPGILLPGPFLSS